MNITLILLKYLSYNLFKGPLHWCYFEHIFKKSHVPPGVPSCTPNWEPLLQPDHWLEQSGYMTTALTNQWVAVCLMSVLLSVSVPWNLHWTGTKSSARYKEIAPVKKGKKWIDLCWWKSPSSAFTFGRIMFKVYFTLKDLQQTTRSFCNGQCEFVNLQHQCSKRDSKVETNISNVLYNATNLNTDGGAGPGFRPFPPRKYQPGAAAPHRPTLRCSSHGVFFSSCW